MQSRQIVTQPVMLRWASHACTSALHQTQCLFCQTSTFGRLADAAAHGSELITLMSAPGQVEDSHTGRCFRSARNSAPQVNFFKCFRHDSGGRCRHSCHHQSSSAHVFLENWRLTIPTTGLSHPPPDPRIARDLAKFDAAAQPMR
jgi:hypothetical protein